MLKNYSQKIQLQSNAGDNDIVVNFSLIECYCEAFILSCKLFHCFAA